jgi:hypothetical protein
MLARLLLFAVSNIIEMIFYELLGALVIRRGSEPRIIDLTMLACPTPASVENFFLGCINENAGVATRYRRA